MIVRKVWGIESWYVNNELYCGKMLWVYPRYQCSLHRHLVKDETFYIHEGGPITLEIGEEIRVLALGDSVRIPPGTWHRFANHEYGHALIMEVSTHHDDADVERKEESRKI